MNKEPNCKLNGHGFNSDGICIYCHEDDGTQTKSSDEPQFANEEKIIANYQANRKVHSPFQEALKLYMSVRGVTARGLGASLRVDHTAISRFVNGSDISQENYTKLLAWFIQKPNYPPSISGETLVNSKGDGDGSGQ